MAGYAIGDSVEFHCSKCKLNLNGNVAAVVDGEVQQVTCRTCRFTVQFKPERSDADIRAEMLKRAFAARDRKQARINAQQGVRATASGGPEVTKRWREATEDSDMRFTQRYASHRSYGEGDELIHKEHGLGVVTQILHEGACLALFRKVEVPLEMNVQQEAKDE
jgi:hypothetical protein